MIRGLLLGLAIVVSGCDASQRTAADFAAAPATAQEVVAACDAGRPRPDCDPARAGLIEARRQERMAAYERAF